MKSDSQTTTGVPTLETIHFPVDHIDPSPYQARKEFADLEGMASSIREHGIIQPLIVRRTAAAPDRLELVAGERRLRGSKLAGLGTVPVIIRELSDTAAEEILLIENLQRVDLRASEEANGLNRMLQLADAGGKTLYTIQSLATKLGKGEKHVSDRLKLLLCPKVLIDEVDGGNVSLSTAMLVGRIPDPKARAACAKEVMTPEHQQVPLNYAQTKELIRERFMVKLDAKRFSLADANLVPVKMDEKGLRCQGGACDDCPFRSGNLADVELQTSTSEGGGKKGGTTRGADPNLCTLPRCHQLKLDAVWRETKLKTERAGKKTLDGKAAEKAFSGHNGGLAWDSGYKMLDERTHLDGLGYVQIRAAIKGQDCAVIVARHPETCETVELISKKDLEKAVAAKIQAEKEKPLSPSQQREADKKKEQRSEELKQQKLDKIALHEGCTDIVEQIHKRGCDADFLSYVFQMALDSGGADGMTFMGQYQQIELPKGGHHSGRDYEDAIIARVKELAETPVAWQAYIVLALLARNLKWRGLRDDDFEQILQRFGIKVKELERRAKALLSAGKKTANKPERKATSDSSNPVDWTADGVASTTAAADRIAKGKEQRAKSPESGPSVSEVVTGIADTKIGKPEKWLPADVEAGAKLLKAKTHKIADLIGPKPVKKDEIKLKNWNAVRVRLLRKAGKAK